MEGSGRGSSKTFATKIGAVLAAAGSAVGLGNVWRFPTEVGSNGGAAFVLVYIGFTLLLGLPVLIAEMAVGRHGQRDVTHSFETMSRHRGWRWMGLFPVFAGILLLGYYSVVAGWTVHYLAEAASGAFSFPSSADFTQAFADYSTDPLRPLVSIGVFLLLTCALVALGVRRGIEQGVRIMMPALFVLLIVLAVCSLFLPNAGAALRFLFAPDFSKLTGSVMLNAMGQAFFSLSVGVGCICTYACYFRKDLNLVKDGLGVVSIDTLVAVMSGLVVFPIVYSVAGIRPDSGPSLVFVTLPNVFQQLFGGVSVLALVLSSAFFLLLVLAALTSSVSLLEMVVAYANVRCHVPRPLAAVLVSSLCGGLAMCCSWSFGIWSDVTIFGHGFFDAFDTLTSKILMPIGALLFCVFFGWVVDERVMRAELTNGGTIRVSLYSLYRFVIRFVAPALIILLFVNELGLLDFLKE